MGLRLPKTKAMLRREAAMWLARLQSGRDPDVEAKFRRWHDRHPAHAAAFERVRGSYDRAGLLRHSRVMSGRPDRIAAPAPGWTPRFALAAAASLAVLGPLGLLIGRSPSGGTEAVMLSTRIGEIRRVSPEPGLKMTLDTATRLEVETGRSIKARLASGRARFEVGEDAGPLIVNAGGAIVTAGAGVVDVERDGEEIEVAVLSGSAIVRGGAGDGLARLLLRPGERMTRENGRARLRILGGPDWTRGMLQFEATPIGDVMAEANRYSASQIAIEGNPAGLAVTGAFRAGDTAGLAKALAAALHLSVRRTADNHFILSRTGASPPPK